MTKEENPPLSWKAQTTRFPHSHRTATAAVLASTPNQSHNHACATRSFPDLPTDSSEEAIFLSDTHGKKSGSKSHRNNNSSYVQGSDCGLQWRALRWIH